MQKEKASDFWDNLSLQEREEIVKASAEIENGEVTDYEIFTKKKQIVK